MGLLGRVLAEVECQRLPNETDAIPHRHAFDAPFHDHAFAVLPRCVKGGAGVFEIADKPLTERAVAGPPDVRVFPGIAYDPESVGLK